jgi:hypothetical protein
MRLDAVFVQLDGTELVADVPMAVLHAMSIAP